MGWFNFFKGKTPGEVETKADALFKDGEFGPAKIEYEDALARHRKKPSADNGFEKRITQKIKDAQNALAGSHIKNSRELMASGCFEDASELLGLAKELAKKDELLAEIDGLLKQIAENQLNELSDRLREGPDEIDVRDASWGAGQGDNGAPEDQDDEQYLTALLNALPPEEQEAYPEYGDAFLKGFMALNRGEFDLAAELMSRALSENSGSSTLIPLELATCYLNMGKDREARTLLESFLAESPEVERAYPLLCETLWSFKEYDQAAHLLDHCPDELADRLVIVILKGETLFQAGKYEEARNYYQEYIDANGRNDAVVRALAEAHKALGEHEKAMALYGELVSACAGCGRRADPELRRCYADAGFDSGRHTTSILEMYLGLAQEDPANRSDYFQKVSRIYASLGNDAEARRFEAFSREEA